MNYNEDSVLLAERDPRCFHEPKILICDNTFLSANEIDYYQQLIQSYTWAPAPSIKSIKYWSKDLYRHYRWDNDWDSARWLDSTPPDWVELHTRIAARIPKHYIHWSDLKATPPLSTGTPRHRDKDPWLKNGSDKFDCALTICVNLNSSWQENWGGEFVLWAAKINKVGKINFTEYRKISIQPGQLLVLENCWHSIAPITQMNQSRLTFIIHVLQYANQS